MLLTFKCGQLSLQPLRYNGVQSLGAVSLLKGVVHAALEVASANIGHVCRKVADVHCGSVNGCRDQAGNLEFSPRPLQELSWAGPLRR